MNSAAKYSSTTNKCVNTTTECTTPDVEMITIKGRDGKRKYLYKF